ncbi:O-antigen polymerase [uncultured Vibrio sp.]|uniref:O-antigen polymerase n=1 Tax=uncultured Vibrio sp. TaxID=114054 RepID=UPI002619D77D|nr:O-antigen polymerase [uncultured Vibrio sp.]
MLINPFVVYAFSFFLVILTYSLGWSWLLPELSTGLYVFLSVSIFNAVILYCITKNKTYALRETEYQPPNFSRVSNFVFFTLLILLLLNFIYVGAIPLFAKLSGFNIDYTDFGIPVVYVIYATAATVFSTVFFDFYLVTGKRKYLLFAFVLVFSFILIFNRGAVIICLAQFFTVYLLRRGLRLKQIIITSVIGLVILFSFGLAGNLRENHDNVAIDSVTSDFILTLGGASDEFISSAIPKEFFWGYLYIATPLANLQNNIDMKNDFDQYDSDSVIFYVLNELLPDTISNRINDIYGVSNVDNMRIATSFTVGTLYGKSYMYLGWLGIIVTNIVFFIILFFSILVTTRPSYTVAPYAVVCVFALFAIFTNVIAFTGISFQLFWAFLVNYFFRVRYNT